VARLLEDFTMRTITATGTVRPDHTLTVTVPRDILPGPRRVVVVLDELLPPSLGTQTLDLTPHPVGLTDPSSTFRREDLYGDDGR
jgi:hypothetical protein